MLPRRPQAVTVGRLLSLLKQSVGRTFAQVLVSGEVIDPLLSQRGHLYFRLSDGEAEIKTVMWRQDVERLRVGPRAGDRVTVRGSLDIYPSRGELQLVASALMLSGRGEKLMALAQLKEKLKAEGVFDRPRKALPPIPRRIGVVTSVGSAVIHDIYQSVQERFPASRLVLSPASVSGAGAVGELMRALRRLESRVDVVIVARGGGSFEELLPFSDERLVRLAAGYPLPLVAAVGHGSDQTLLDLVADHTAPTPTAAAVLVTPEREELLVRVEALRSRARRGMERLLTRQRHILAEAAVRCRGYHPQVRLAVRRQKFEHLRQRLEQRAGALITEERQRLLSLVQRLRGQGPKELLARGFTVVYTGGKVVTGVHGRTAGEELELHFADGTIVAEIKRVEPK